MIQRLKTWTFPARHLLRELWKARWDPRAMWNRVAYNVRSRWLRDRLASVESLLHPAARTTSPVAQDDQVQALAEEGLVVGLDVATPDLVEDLARRFAEHDLYDPYRPHHGTFRLDAVPDETHVARLTLEDIARTPGALAVASHPLVLDLFRRTFGREPTLDVMEGWYSLPGHEAPEEAQNFHRDSDHLQFAKLFLFLTDVDTRSGPHVFVPGTHRLDRLTQPERLTFDEVEGLAPRYRPVEVAGPAGTAFLARTWAIHRGKPPVDRRRLVLECTFSVAASQMGPPAPFLEPEEAEVLAGRPLDPYVFRRFVRAPGG